jgi:hypothetical protein
MQISNLIYAKFHTIGDISIKGYFDPNVDTGDFLKIYRTITDLEKYKLVGLLHISHIVFIEYLDAE